MLEFFVVLGILLVLAVILIKGVSAVTDHRWIPDETIITKSDIYVDDKGNPRLKVSDRILKKGDLTKCTDRNWQHYYILNKSTPKK